LRRIGGESSPSILALAAANCHIYQSGTPSGLEMLHVPAGEVDLGAEDFGDSRPVHTVDVDAFYLGRFEVTQQQWTKAMSENPSAHQDPNHPVEHVS
jgi:formylglycine-generating enzyme required for sulfatase activity